MSHEDFLQPEELDAMRKQYQESPPRETSVLSFLKRTEGCITVDIPPITIPTPAKAARWLGTSPAVWVLFYIVIGFGIGYFVHHSPLVPIPPVPVVPPVPPVPSVETLVDFIAKESKALTDGERRKLITVTETILAQHFDTSSALREEFYYLRLKAGLHDSPGFNTFWNKVADKVYKTADGSRVCATNTNYQKEVKMFDEFVERRFWLVAG
jgi:hypothetical protein